MQITRELFDQQRRPRFGNANPERMQLAFWEWMIRGDELLPVEGDGCLAERGWVMRDGKLKSVFGPYRARDLFKVPLNREEGPIWTFERMGQTQTELPDGRVVCIGGEHEDYYDPDFYIYNDVVVFSPTGEIEIYGYPKEVFPPTDFHTATLSGGQIIIVGCVGHKPDWRSRHTPVYALDLSSYRISMIEASGDVPGWISRHQAELESGMGIIIRNGDIIDEREGDQRFRRNFQDYALEIGSWTWHRVTNRNWRQFLIRREDNGLFLLEDRPEPEALVPRKVKHTVLVSSDWKRARFLVRRVPVSLTIDLRQIEVLVEGNLSSKLSMRVAEEILANAKNVLGVGCILEQV